MSDGGDPTEVLLVENAEAAWGDIEAVGASGPGGRRAAPAPDVSELLAAMRPGEMIEFLRTKGVLKVGSFEYDEDLVLAAVGEETFLTMPAETRELANPEAAWRAELHRLAASRNRGFSSSGNKAAERARRGAASGKANADWTRVTAEAFVVNVRDAAAPDVDGLVGPLLRRHQAGALPFSVFALPSIQALLQYKWQRFARKVLLVEFLVYATWLACFSAFAILWQDEDTSATLAQLAATHAGRLTIGLELIGSICMLPFLLLEIGTIQAYGFGGWFSVWNGLDTITYVFQALITLLHISRVGADSGWLSIVVAVQAVALWTRLTYFSRLFGSSSFSFSFVDSLTDVVNDAGSAFGFVLLLLWGFALSFAVLFRREQEGFEQFSTIGRSLLTVFGFALGGVDLEVMLQSHNARAALALGLLLQFGVSLLLMNMLTGLMCSSFNRSTEHEDQKVLLSLASIIDEIEAVMPPAVERWLIGSFAARPPFIHVLRISASTDDVVCAPRKNKDAAGASAPADQDDEDESDDEADKAGGGSGWQVSRRGGGGEGGRGGGGGASSGEVAAMRRELAALRKQVQALHDTLSLAVPSLPPSPPQVALPAASKRK
jgi:hypothetical protein